MLPHPLLAQVTSHPCYFADANPLRPDLVAAGTGPLAAVAASSDVATAGPTAAASTVLPPASKMLSMPLPRPPTSASSSSDRTSGPSATLPAPVTALDDDFCILLWKVSLIRQASSQLLRFYLLDYKSGCHLIHRIPFSALCVADGNEVRGPWPPYERIPM